MPDLGEDADAPIIVPRPGQILRRSARTKIRKQGQTGEGAHRFNATRRGAGSKRATPPPVPDPRSSSDLSTSDHDHDHDQSDAESPRRRRLLSNESIDGTSRSGRPESYSVEAFIFDAYARDDISEDSIRVISPPPPQPLPRHSLSPPPLQGSREVSEPAPPIQVLPPVQPTPVLPPLQHPLPQRASSLNTPTSVETPSRSPSPVTTIHADHLSSARSESRPAQTSSTSLPPALPGPQGSDSRREKDKDKDKKGLFKWGGGGEKKGKKDQREKEKDAGFFGSLFGSKKKPEESAPAGLAHGQSGRDAAVALLGASKSSRGYVPPASPQLPGVNNYSRYPIHVERAIYRLSHIKLANPRRALYEQVLISNLMFWYLGVINKTQQPQSQQQQTPQEQRQTPTELGEVQSPAVTGGSVPQKEQEDKERVELEQAESERGEAKFTMQGQSEAQQPLPQGRRASLTKTTPANAGPRRAEQPVRGPQYDMQHRAMEQEYGAVFAGGARPTTGPPGIGYAVPPGAMQISGPTAAVSTPLQPPALTAGGPRRSRSPPPPAGSGVRYVPPPPPPPALPQPQAHATTPMASTSSNPTPSPTMSAAAAILAASEGAPARGPGRSLSANAVPPMGPRGQGRKAQSVHAVTALGARRPRTAESPGVGEEEDVPLALWQQQQQQQQQQQSLLTQQPRRR
jgi:Activator of mitotic machinery Cdc14 phosphatase activation C-term